MSWTKVNTILLQAGSFCLSYYRRDGFQIFKTYFGDGIILRILRELCFRLPFLPKQIWYNKEFLNIDAKYIILRDPLITRDYIEWLHNHYPKAKIIFQYANMVGKARHLYPDKIPKYVTIWTYDDYDSKKYNINLFKARGYLFSMAPQTKNAIYDIFYVGRDKGRGDWLNDFEKKLSQAGVKTKFVITKDGRLSRNKDYYQKEISYEAVLDYLSKSKSVLNVALPNQQGITLRDLEAAFIGIKLITTNANIRNYDIYSQDNVFLLDKENIDINQIKEFIDMPVVPWPNHILEKYTLEKLLDEITK